jgi:O-antigen ligase
VTVLARAGWLLSAAFFGTILSSVLLVDHLAVSADILLLLIAVVAALRPDVGVMVVVAVTPVAWYLASQTWHSNIVWAEAIACAVLTGASLNAVRGRDGDGRLPLSLSAPAVLFGAIVVASLIASLGPAALRLGPAFANAFVTQLTREYFTDVRGFPGLHAGALLLEGLVLFAVAARIAAGRQPGDGLPRRIAAAAAASAALAGALNIDRLVRSAARGDSFWASLGDLADRFRWNVHYTDFNAAGSYFVMTALVAAALAVSVRGGRRIAWAAAAATIAAALWLTSSRVAVLAGVLAPGAIFMLAELARGRARAMRAAGIAAAGVVLLAVMAIALPQRGNQKSSLIATDVRFGLIQTGARMIASYPVFGIGLAEFYQRSGEFSSPDLIAKFPVAVHENAHNNFVQVAAELGVAGGLLFAWLIAAALAITGRRAVTTRDPFLLLTFAGLGAFVLTCLGGHPLLIPEAGYVFWTMLGVAAGASASPGHPRSRLRWLVAICLATIALTLPWRVRATMQDADLEHAAIGVLTNWQDSPDGRRYREFQGSATLFVPQGSALRLGVYPLTDQPVRLEIRLDGRVADIVLLTPRQWNDLTVPARNVTTPARYGPLDLRLIDASQTAMWITKVQPIH